MQHFKTCIIFISNLGENTIILESIDVLFEFHLKFWKPPVLVFQLEVYYNVDSLLTGLTAQPKGTTARWYSNKTSLCVYCII